MVQDDVWIIVPALNEGARLDATLRSVCDGYGNVVVVNDGSDDDSSEIAARHPVWRVDHLVNCGQGAALQTGIDFALGKGAQILVTFDADGQHCVEDIAPLCATIRDGRFDVVLGSRFLGEAQGIPWGRWLTLKLGVVFTRWYSGIRVTDTHNGLRAFTREAATRIKISQNRMAHASEILDQIHRLRLRYCEIPTTVRYTDGALEKGQTSWNGLRIVGQLFMGRLTR